MTLRLPPQSPAGCDHASSKHRKSAIASAVIQSLLSRYHNQRQSFRRTVCISRFYLVTGLKVVSHEKWRNCGPELKTVTTAGSVGHTAGRGAAQGAAPLLTD